MSASGLRSNNAQWDFWSLSPESLHQVSFLMSDRGTPRTWRHMNGYSSHTYMWENADGERVWVKYHFKTGQGIQNFTDAEAKAMSAEDPDYHRRDLRESIRRGDHPVWRLEMQIMPFKDAATYRFNPFDLYRIGTNYEQLPVNRPVVEVHNYNKDGAMRYEHSDDQPPYAPNSYGGPKADSQRYGGVVATGGPRARPAHRPGPRRGLASSRCRPLTTVVEDAGNRA